MKDGETDYLIGPLRIDVAAKRLLREANGERVAADAQQVDVLVCLIRAFPAIVSKDQLIDQVWGGRYVTEAALHKTLSNLRKLLREAHDGAELIETRYRRGYQLTLAPQSVPARASTTLDVAATETTDAPAPAPADRSDAASHWPWFAAAACVAVLLLTLWWHGQRLPAPERPPLPPPPVEAALQASMAQLDEAALIQVTKDALSRDAEAARRATSELRRRGASSPRLAGLADKYDGILAYRAGDFAQAEADYLRALPHFERVGDRLEQANVLNNLGVLLAETGRQPDRAESMYRRALALREELGDAAAVLASHRNLSNLFLESGQLSKAMDSVAAYESAAEQQAQVVDRVEARILRGDVALRTEPAAARASFESAMALALEHGLPLAAASASQRLGRLALRAGDPTAARAAFQRSLDWYRESDGSHQLDVLLYNLATAVEASAEPAEAIRHYLEVLAADAEAKPSVLRVDTRLALARLYARTGDAATARGELASAQAEALSLHSERALAAVSMAQAEFAMRDADWLRARQALNEAQLRMQESEDEELQADWRWLDLWQRWAAQKGDRWQQDFDQLQADLGERGDHLRLARMQALAALQAATTGDRAAAFRTHVSAAIVHRAEGGKAAPIVADSENASGFQWSTLLALGLGCTLGFAIARARR